LSSRSRQSMRRGSVSPARSPLGTGCGAGLTTALRLHLQPLLERAPPLVDGAEGGGEEPRVLGPGCVRAQVLLRHRLEPPPPRRGGTQHLARHREGPIDLGAVLRVDVCAEPVPGLLIVVGRTIAARRDLQLADGLDPCARDPSGLGLAQRHRQDGLRPPHGDLPRAHRRVEQRAHPELPRQPGHVLGSAPRDPQHLPPVVRHGRVAEHRQPIALVQLVQPLTDGQVHGPAGPGQPRQQQLRLLRHLARVERAHLPRVGGIVRERDGLVGRHRGGRLVERRRRDGAGELGDGGVLGHRSK